MLYENDLCAGCEKEFTQGDDIVVCPVCGAPQHRECWLEHGTCVSEARHAEGFLWKRSGETEKTTGKKAFNPSADAGEICPVCGTNNPPGTAGCEHCKNAPVTANPGENTQEPPAVLLKTTELPFLSGISPQEDIGGTKAYDIALYTQFGAKRYIDKFRKMESTGSKLGWNWGAFLFSPYWFFYRKLYWLGGIFLGLTLTAAIFFSGPMIEVQREYAKLIPVLSNTQLSNTDITSAVVEQMSKYFGIIYGFFGILILLHTVSALIANHAYKKKVMAEVTSIRRFAKDENVFRMLTIKRGGASMFALFASVLGYDLCLSLVTYFVQRL